MTKAKAAKVIAVLQVNYPDNFRGKSDETLKATVDLWFRAFSDDEYAVVSAAVMAHIVSDTNRFMPPIGVIKAKITELTSPEEMTEQEAWGLVANAIRNGIYGASEEFAKLPPTVQRTVGGAQQLREWAMMDSDTLHSVVASNFQRSYRVALQREKDWSKLPSGVKQFVGELTEQNFQKLNAPEEDPERNRQNKIYKLLSHPNEVHERG